MDREYVYRAAFTVAVTGWSGRARARGSANISACPVKPLTLFFYGIHSRDHGLHLGYGSGGPEDRSLSAWGQELLEAVETGRLKLTGHLNLECSEIENAMLLFTPHRLHMPDCPEDYQIRTQFYLGVTYIHGSPTFVLCQERRWRGEHFGDDSLLISRNQDINILLERLNEELSSMQDMCGGANRSVPLAGAKARLLPQPYQLTEKEVSARLKEMIETAGW